jgi:hypothetical protein
MTSTSSSPDESGQGNVVPLRGSKSEERKEAVLSFVRDHPGLTLAGGILAGIVASSLIPRAPVRKLAGRASAVSEVVGAAAIALGRQALESAEAAGSELRTRGSHVAERAEKLGEAAAARVGKVGETAASGIGKAGERASEMLAPAEATIEDVVKQILRVVSDLRAKVRS